MRDLFAADVNEVLVSGQQGYELAREFMRTIMPDQIEPVRQAVDRLFKEYGLPSIIRSDNGAPFASTGIHGLSALNVWWMQLGIVHQ